MSDTSLARIAFTLLNNSVFFVRVIDNLNETGLRGVLPRFFYLTG